MPDFVARQSCETCAYFEGNRPEGSPIGECRIRSVPTDDFPRRHAFEWCGEWREKKAKEAAPEPENEAILIADIYGVSSRLRGVLANAGVRTLRELSALGRSNLGEFRNCGWCTCQEAEVILKAHGMTWDQP